MLGTPHSFLRECLRANLKRSERGPMARSTTIDDVIQNAQVNNTLMAGKRIVMRKTFIGILLVSLVMMGCDDAEKRNLRRKNSELQSEIESRQSEIEILSQKHRDLLKSSRDDANKKDETITMLRTELDRVCYECQSLSNRVINLHGRLTGYVATTPSESQKKVSSNNQGMLRKCPNCQTGSITKYKNCVSCGGRGRILVDTGVRKTFNKLETKSRNLTCRACGGKGRVPYSVQCPRCNGTRYIND